MKECHRKAKVTFIETLPMSVAAAGEQDFELELNTNAGAQYNFPDKNYYLDR